jgi:hypothetical protein
MKGVEFSLQDLKQLKDAYEQAVKDEKESFEFHGEEVITDFAKYMIQFLENVYTDQSADRMKRLPALAMFFAKAGLDTDEISELLLEIGTELRNFLTDEQKTEYDESSEDAQRGFVCAAILDGEIGIGIETIKTDEPKSETFH